MMFYNNPFAELATVIPAYVMQYFVVAMVLLIVVGVGLDMLHKKNVVYFFRNAQKAKKSAKTMAEFSDGIIIGSSIVELINKHSKNKKIMNNKLSSYISSIARVM